MNNCSQILGTKFKNIQALMCSCFSVAERTPLRKKLDLDVLIVV